jgi:integrase
MKTMPKYKQGKILESLEFPEIQKKMLAARAHLTLESQAYFWLLYYTGCRKSEAYERKIQDAQLTENYFIIDFGERKKHGATVPPIQLPIVFPGVDLLCQQLLRARKRKSSWKLITFQEETEEPSLNKAGKPILRRDGLPKLMKRAATKKVKATWLFPHINRTWAAQIVKKILGQKYYPHFLRLNRITELASDPTSNLTRLKSYTGIRSLDALSAYMGTSRKEQDAAMDYMAKQIRPENKKE